MDDAGAERVSAGGKRLAAAEEGVDERAGGIASAGVHGHSGRLVDDDEVGVFVEDVEGDIFGGGLQRRAGLRVDGDALAAFELEGILGGVAVDEDKAGVD